MLTESSPPLGGLGGCCPPVQAPRQDLKTAHAVSKTALAERKTAKRQDPKTTHAVSKTAKRQDPKTAHVVSKTALAERKTAHAVSKTFLYFLQKRHRYSDNDILIKPVYTNNNPFLAANTYKLPGESGERTGYNFNIIAFGKSFTRNLYFSITVDNKL